MINRCEVPAVAPVSSTSNTVVLGAEEELLYLKPVSKYDVVVAGWMYATSVYPAGSRDFFAYRQYSVVSPVMVKVYGLLVTTLPLPICHPANSYPSGLVASTVTLPSLTLTGFGAGDDGLAPEPDHVAPLPFTKMEKDQF